MEGGTAVFIVVMTSILVVGALLNTLIRTWRTGRAAPSGELLDAVREAKLLTNENAGLRAQVIRLEERIAVLERIATDPAHRTIREIEELR